MPGILPFSINNSLFSKNYAHARSAFLAAAAQLEQPKKQRGYSHPLPGPDGESLALDALWIGELSARRIVVVSSACHGVEGFAGSAIQRAIIENLQTDSPASGTAYLFLHAINPWGFAYQRRSDENNVDVNRNFVDFAKPLPANPGYVQLADAILPENLKESEISRAQAQLDAYQRHHGQQELEEAISAGQYTHADGLFYGGKAPGWSRNTLEKLYNDFQLEQAEKVIVIDLHTGLGPYGYGEIISDHKPGSKGALLARQVFGHSVTEPLCGTSSSVPKFGLMDFFWHRKLANRGCFVTLEFGTFSIDSLWSSLRADHWLAKHAGQYPAAHETYRKIKQQLLQHFNPNYDDWREMVLFRGQQVFNQAVQALADEKNSRE